MYQAVVRGMYYQDDIQDFDQLRTRAVFNLFDSICKTAEAKQPKQALALQEWDEFLLTQIQRASADITADNISDENISNENELLLETALRIIGQSGYVAAEGEIERLCKKLAAAHRERQYRACCIREETDYALVKIELQNRWSAERARELIHGNRRSLHAENDLAQWIRGLYFDRERIGYHDLLRHDLKAAADPLLLLETLKELAKRFHGQDMPEIAELLSHPNPEVTADAAFILLDASLDPRPDPSAALAAIERMAGDPNTPLPAEAHYFDIRLARMRALEFMCGVHPCWSDPSCTRAAIPTPPGIRWNVDRVRAQLQSRKTGEWFIQFWTGLKFWNIRHHTENSFRHTAAHFRCPTVEAH